jgi:hypothetical protein
LPIFLKIRNDKDKALVRVYEYLSAILFCLHSLKPAQFAAAGFIIHKTAGFCVGFGEKSGSEILILNAFPNHTFSSFAFGRIGGHMILITPDYRIILAFFKLIHKQKPPPLRRLADAGAVFYSSV